MKPTPTLEQVNSLYNIFADRPGGLRDLIPDMIEYWESIRPADEPDRWIPLSERRPTAGDEDKNGQVFVISDSGYAIGIRRINMNPVNHSHWRRTNLPRPTEAEIEEKEIRAAYEDDDSVGLTFDSFKVGWLAHKSKTAKP